jgi:hypothetical protein
LSRRRDVSRGPRTKKKENVNPRKPWDYDLFGLVLPSYRKNRELNVVIFRGISLLGRIVKYRISHSEWHENEFYRKTPDEIDTALSASSEYKKYDLAFQDTKEVIFVGGGIRYNRK